MLKNEIKRALSSKGMILALLVGIGICSAYSIERVMNMIKSSRLIEEGGFYGTLCSLAPSDYWICGSGTKYSIYFYYLFPLLATLPFATSYCREYTSGYTKNILSRVSARKYALSKCIAVFVVGGVAVTVPILLNLIWTFTVIPYQKPVAYSLAPLASGYTALGDVYFDYPYIYCMLYILLTFVLSGALATLSLVISLYSKNYFTILLLPFIIIMVLETVVVPENKKYLPMTFLNPSMGGEKFLYGIILSISILIVSVVMFVKNLEKRDCL